MNVFLELVKTLVPAMTAVIGGLWVAWTYVDNQRAASKHDQAQAERDERTRRIEAQKPFSSIQLSLFMEAGKVTGELAAFDKSTENWADSAEWKGYYTRFYQLFWTELSIVEDDDIKSSMVQFSAQLKTVLREPKNETAQKELQQVAYRLARTIRKSIQNTWDVDLGLINDPSKR